MASRSLAVLIVVLLALPTGCATRSYAPTSAAATGELKIKVGDDIRVVTTRRERIWFRITEVRSDRFVGVISGRIPENSDSDPFPRFASPAKHPRPAPGEPVEVPYDELAVVQVTRFDAGKAALATAVIAVTVTAAAAVIRAAPPVGFFPAPP